MSALDDDDSPISQPPTSNPNIPPTEEDDEDALPDYLQLSNLIAKSKGSIPKRGEKDFERHGTKHQDSILERSREAMHDALAYTRVHGGKGSARGIYFGGEDTEQVGLGGDYVVWVEKVIGSHFKIAGRARGVTSIDEEGKEKAVSLLWLLPEEALYLVERGNLDLWWPGEGVLRRLEGEEVEVEDEGTPMSLQAAYAMLIGRDGEKGKVELDRYTVYANLRRTGYAVLRAAEWDATKPGAKPNHEFLRQISTPTAAEPQSVFTWLWGKYFAEEEIQPQPHGPLIGPGLYRSYNAIYKQLAIIPRHKPSAIPTSPAPPPEAPFRVIFNVWKPSPTFTKSQPGKPDFRVAVVNANRNSVPTLTQITSLLESQPYDPPEMKGNGQLYQRMRKGYRSVVLAVVDEGIISYLRFGEGAFGEELIFERFDDGQGGRGGKHGGRGRGGRGRGRGGRGGRGRGS